MEVKRKRDPEEHSEIPDFLYTEFNKNDIQTPTIEDETLEWYRMSPSERFKESQKLWEIFIILGGNYDPEPDTRSSFHIFTI